MSTIRTSSIFHYTRRINFLKSILEKGIIPNYCLERYPVNGSKDYEIGIPMVSFCDIPLTRIHDFSKKYGFYGIGLSKKWAIKNQINPVLYISSSILINSLYDIRTIKKNTIKAKEQYFEKYGVIDPETGDTILYVDEIPDNNNLITNLMLSSSSKYLFINFYGFSKCVTDICQKNTVYEENEWRFLVRETDKIKWLWNKIEYDNWRDPGKYKPNSGIPPLKFSIEDINYIIVKKEAQIPSFIDFINRLTTLGGSKKELTEDDKKILMSKIISLEIIKTDF